MIKACKIYLACFFSLASFLSYGQHNYTVIYTSTVGHPFHLAIQDSIAYCYYPDALAGKKMQAPVPLGSGYWPKMAYFDAQKGIEIYQEGMPGKIKTQILIERKSEKGNWTIAADKKEIQGYTCMKAYGKIANRAFIVWYCPDMPAGFGPYLFTSLPGTILECLDVSTGVTATATEIKTECLPVVEPSFCKRVQRNN